MNSTCFSLFFKTWLLEKFKLHIWLPFVAHVMFLLDGAELDSDNVDEMASYVPSTVLFLHTSLDLIFMTTS